LKISKLVTLLYSNSRVANKFDTLLSQFLTLDITAMQSQMYQHPFHNNDNINNLKNEKNPIKCKNPLSNHNNSIYRNTMHFWVMLLSLGASLVSFTK